MIVTAESSSYLLTLEFLGYRYSGWQIQPGQKTVEGMVKKTFRFVLGEIVFKILGAGRTDARVSALDFKCQLFLEEHRIVDFQEFMVIINQNLPPDIRLTGVENVVPGFNVIKDVASKLYTYRFCFGQKMHPYCAPFMACYKESLNYAAMKKAAALFSGIRNFKAFTAQPKETKNYIREINRSTLTEIDHENLGYFPPKSYEFKVEGKGFVRYQVRMMMAALVDVGRGDLHLEDLKSILENGVENPLTSVAPASGLTLEKITFQAKKP